MNKYIISVILSIVTATFMSCSDKDDTTVDISDWKVTCNSDPRTSMTITAQMPKDSLIKISSNDKMAVFIGNECRGVVSPNIDEDDENGLYFLLVTIKQPEDELLNQNLSLFYYSAVNDRIYKAKDTDLILEKDKIIGSIEEPYSTTWALYR